MRARVLCVVVFMLALPAAAATKTWNGVNGSSWSNNGNWTPPAAPVAGDNLVFPANSAMTPVYTFTSTNDLAPNTTFGSLSISGSGYTIGGNAIALSGGIVANPSSGANTIQFDTDFISTQAVSATFISTSLTMTGVITLNTLAVVTVGGSGDILFTNVVQGAGHLTKSGVGRLTLAGANAYLGGTQIIGGALRIQNPNALGATSTGTTVAAGAALEIDSGVSGFATDPMEPLTLNGSGIAGNGALVLVNGPAVYWNGAVTLTSAATIGVSSTMGGGGPPFVSVYGTISGSGDLAIYAPTGEVVLAGSNTYTGTTTIQNGILRLNSTSALGATSAGTVVQSGGQLIFRGSIGVEHLTLNGPGPAGQPSLVAEGASCSWAGDILLGSNSLVYAELQLTLNGVVSEASAGLTLDYASDMAAGTLILNGNNTYSTTAIRRGTVLINGLQLSSNVTLDGGLGPFAGKLGGTGTVGAVAATNTGIVSPGSSPGVLTVDTLTMSAGTTFRAEINGPNVGTDFDQLVVNNGVALGNATLQVVPGYTPTPGTTFRILRKVASSAITGTFNGLPQGSYFAASGQEFQISYTGGTGNDVVLNAISSPTTTITPAGPTNLCSNGGMITLTAQTPSGGTGIYTGYSWFKDGSFTGATGTMYLATTPGSYTVRVTDSTSNTGPDSPASVVNQDGTAPTVTPPTAMVTTQTLCS